MDGHGGNDVIFASGQENYSDAIRRAGEKLLDFFTDRTLEMMNVVGCDGVGRWRIIEYATKKLKRSHLFDLQILVKLPNRDISLERVQMEIANQLHLTASISPDDDKTKFTITAGDICKSLVRRRFLLIVGDVTSVFDLQSMGIPLRRGLPYDSKVVYVGNSILGLEVALKNPLQSIVINIDFEELSIDTLREEAGVVAHSPGINGCFTPEGVLHCCLYLWVFLDAVIPVDMLIRDWLAEGITFTGGREEDEEETSRLVENALVLLRELELRSLLLSTVTNSGAVAWVAPAWVSQNAGVRDLARALTRGRYWIDSPPGEIILSKTSLPAECLKLSTLQLGLLNYPYSNFEFIIPDPFFEQMQYLQVLHIYNLHIIYLPHSIACLHNLRLLRINYCYHLESLPSSLQALHKLEFLEIYGSHSLETMADECFQQMTNLRSLILNGFTKIQSLPSSVSKLCTLQQLVLTNCPSLMEIPDKSFECMKRLQLLDLSNDSNLKSLPSSLTKLINLRQLILANCYSLKMKLLPHLQKLSALEELFLCKCDSLEDIEDVSSSLGNILPKLRKLDLSGIESISRVSLNGCQSLEYVGLNGLTSLQVLSISGTKIKCFPENNMVGTNHLRRLDMLHMNHIHEIKWDDLSPELENLNIVQCGTVNSSEENDKCQRNIVGARIRVSNHHLLQFLSPLSKVWEEKCFSQFHICIAACQEDELQRQFIYVNIGSKTQICSLATSRHFNRHLEIRGGNTSPNGIHGVLRRTELFTLCDNAFVQRLSDVGMVDSLIKLIECRVERCKRMEIFFEGFYIFHEPLSFLKPSSFLEPLSLLENIWMSNLASLRSVCEGRYGRQSFTLLKHIYLECCPRLVVVFSSAVHLESLETLQIKFCNRLEAVFRGVAKGSLQRLRTVCLWELPKLESICGEVCLPALEKLRGSGCPKLNNLPLQVHCDNAAASTTAIGGGALKVEGDLVWWASLKLEGDNIKDHVHFKERRPFIRRS